MKRFFAPWALGSVFFVAAIADASAADAVVGSWIFDPAKSKFDPGPAPKAMARTYAVDGDTTTLTFSITTADGSTSSGKSAYKYDGKDYPFSGSTAYDMIAVKKINGSTARSSLKKGGKQVGTTVRTVAGHGRLLTLTNKFTDAKGVAHSDVAVFDRQ